MFLSVVNMSFLRTVAFETVFLWIKLCKALELLFIKTFASYFKNVTIKIFKKAKVHVGGKEPADIRVLDDKFYEYVAGFATLGLGESYIKGWWEVDDLEEFSFRVLRRGIHKYLMTPNNKFYNFLLFDMFNLQAKSRAREVAEKHYDLGNDLFQAFLDPTMTYSCGYWRNADNVHEAQLNKLDLIARKLKLEPGMKVLDIGSGWGSLCKYLAENYDVEVVGYNISEQQIKYSREICKGLKVEIRDADYREIEEKFDRIVSVGMFEHVGESNYKDFFGVAHRCLTDDGIFLLHSIGVNHATQPLVEPFAHTYIFPNGKLPYYKHITQYTEGLFIIEDWHNFGNDYSKTLKAWYSNFEKNWPKLSDKYGNDFYRLWKFYLNMASGLFRSRRLQLWQVVMSKHGLEGGYESVR